MFATCSLFTAGMNEYWKEFAGKLIDFSIVLLKTAKLEEEKKVQKKYNAIDFSESDDD